MSLEAQPDVRIVGYCRACGKALDEASVRNAQGTIYCEEHLPAGMAAAPVAGAYTRPVDSPYTAPAPPPVPQSDVSPGVAFVLGLIPGVGAIYNAQYAKGLVHVLFFGLLIVAVNNTDQFEVVFGLMIPAFIFYMAFEAYHTARKRRMGEQVDEFSSIVPARGGSQFPVIPILLIAFGAIILLDNLGLFEIRTILRYWPVMLIALGVYLLVGRFSGKPGAGDRS
jgi:hypothetical protein